MNKIISEDQVAKTSVLEKTQNNKIVLTGGCFDILHPGHIFFLEKAKSLGNVLFLFLESDESVKKRKGNDRPINDQLSRAKILSALPSVNYIILLKGVTNNAKYDKLIVQIKPDVIALTNGDPQIKKREKQSDAIGAKLRVIEKFDTASTSDLIKNNG